MLCFLIRNAVWSLKPLSRTSSVVRASKSYWHSLSAQEKYSAVQCSAVIISSNCGEKKEGRKASRKALWNTKHVKGQRAKEFYSTRGEKCRPPFYYCPKSRICRPLEFCKTWNTSHYSPALPTTQERILSRCDVLAVCDSRSSHTTYVALERGDVSLVWATGIQYERKENPSVRPRPRSRLVWLRLVISAQDAREGNCGPRRSKPSHVPREETAGRGDPNHHMRHGTSPLYMGRAIINESASLISPEKSYICKNDVEEIFSHNLRQYNWAFKPSVFHSSKVSLLLLSGTLLQNVHRCWWASWKERLARTSTDCAFHLSQLHRNFPSLALRPLNRPSSTPGSVPPTQCPRLSFGTEATPGLLSSTMTSVVLRLMDACQR